MSMSDEIQRLHDLRQAGALTEAEFEQAKAKLLSSQVSLDKPSSGGSGGSSDFGTQMNNLRRVRADRWMAGVCAGLARTTKTDAWIWRLAFALMAFAGAGAGLFIYILLWIFVPEEE
jgi:phage shock protein C